MSTSGHGNYMHGFAAAQGKHHEWPTAENSAAYLLPRLQALREQNPEIHLLDIGAGPGTLTAFLAKCIPEGQVTATDISSEILVSAEEHAQSIGIQNITFTQANVYNVSRQLGKATFDVTHAHQVLCHLFDPILAIREMLRVTKPGGVVALRDVDMRTWCFWPELPDLLRFQKVMMVTMDRTGGGRMAGRQLVSWALRAGANRENITATYGTCCYSSPAERQLWGTTMAERARKGPMRQKAVVMGLATERDMDDMARAWEEWIRTEDATLGMMHGEVLIQNV